MQLRDYEDGALVREEPIPEEQLEAVLGKRAAPVKRRQRRARAKARHRCLTAAPPLAAEQPSNLSHPLADSPCRTMTLCSRLPGTSQYLDVRL